MSGALYRTTVVVVAALLVTGTGVVVTATSTDADVTTRTTDATASADQDVQNESVPITIRNLTAPETVRIGTNYTVSATIVNQGDQLTNERVNYQIAANVIKTKSVEISGNDTTRIEFDITESDTAGFPTGTFVHGVFSQRANSTANVTLVEGTTTPAETTTETTVTPEENVTEATETTTEENVTEVTETTTEENVTEATETTTEVNVTEVTETTTETTVTPEENVTEATETTTEVNVTEVTETTTEVTATETTTEADVTEENVTETTTEATPAEAAASLVFTNQDSNGSAVTVQSATLPEGGFVVVHSTGVVEGEVVPSIVGESGYLEAGTHRNFTVELDEPITQSQRLVAIIYRDSNDNQEFDFVESGRTADGPYTEPNSEEAVNRIAVVSVVEQPTNETTEA